MIDVRIGQLALKLGVHRNTISNWIKSGKLKAIPTVGKRYLIEEWELHRFLTEAHIPVEVITTLAAPPGFPAQRVIKKIKLQNPPLQSEVRMTGKPIGSVMVVGGGIAGIQASLDLANSGYFVHLVERSAAIGGAMAQLDKTYPTNDCAM
jgi:excisionase family DNA binding protein